MYHWHYLPLCFFVLQACGYPLYWKGILFSAAGGDKTGLLSYVAFSDFWRKMCGTHHDEAAQIMHILTFKNPSNRKGLLAPEDFVPLVQDVVDTHPGLGFLKEATEFHSRYVHTVSDLELMLTINLGLTCSKLCTYSNDLFKVLVIQYLTIRACFEVCCMVF